MRVGAVTILVSQLLYFLLYLAKKKKDSRKIHYACDE